MTPEPTPPSNQPLNEQIAEIALKVIMAGGLAGAGIGAFWQLLVESDIPKAIASAVIGLGISYGATLLQPIHRGNEQRLEKWGEAVNQGIDRAGETAIAAITSVDERYLACQVEDCAFARTEGLGKISGIFTPILDQVFVPLALDRSACLPGWQAHGLVASANLAHDEEPAAIAASLTLDIWQLLAQVKPGAVYRQIAVLAWGGYGKTTL